MFIFCKLIDIILIGGIFFKMDIGDCLVLFRFYYVLRMFSL